jgi:hypothetical protein
LGASRDPAFEQRLEVLRTKLAALDGPAVVVDLCSGKGSFSAALIPEFPNVHVLNYDKVGPDPRYLGWRTPGNASRHAHVTGDVRKLTKAQIGADIERIWGLTCGNVVFVNLAPNCRNISTAPEFGSHPLREGPAGGWAATTDDSVADDELREWCFKLFRDIDVEEQGRVAIVFEHPALGHLFAVRSGLVARERACCRVLRRCVPPYIQFRWAVASQEHRVYHHAQRDLL